MGWPFQKTMSVHLSTKHGKLTDCQYAIKQQATHTSPYYLCCVFLSLSLFHQYLFPALLRGRSSVIAVGFCLLGHSRIAQYCHLFGDSQSITVDAVEPPGSVGPDFCAWSADRLPAPRSMGPPPGEGHSPVWVESCLCCLHKDLWASVCAHEPRWSRCVCLWVLEHLEMYVDVPESVFIKFIKCSVQAACIMAQCLSK